MESRTFEAAMFFRVVQKMDAEIFTPDEMRRLLDAAGTNVILPMLAIGGFAGMRHLEITRLDWSEILWDRNLIEVKGYKSKTRARRLVPLLDNLRAWIAPFAEESGPVVLHRNPTAAMAKIAARAGVAWKLNALRHSFCSYRLSMTNDGAKTALESGHDQSILFRHYHALVSTEAAQEWFSIYPKGQEPANKEPQPGNVIKMDEEVAPEIRGEIGLNALEIRKALFGAG
jgi:integrase